MAAPRATGPGTESGLQADSSTSTPVGLAPGRRPEFRGREPSPAGYAAGVRPVRLVALVSLLALASACSGERSPGRTPSFVRVSGPAPPISGPTLTGGTFSPRDYRGKVLVVNFWNPYCAPCREEQPVLQAAWERFRGQGVAFVGLVYVGGNPPWPDDRAAARQWLREFGVSYPNLVDEGSRWAEGFAIRGIPTTVLVDRDGEMRFQVLGRVREGQLAELLGELGVRVEGEGVAAGPGSRRAVGPERQARDGIERDESGLPVAPAGREAQTGQERRWSGW
jgi:cytochrome c biogenesis protein CcmG/thiol:disulfide interchange protein DsbE